MEKNCGMEEEEEEGWRGSDVLAHFQSRLEALEQGMLRSARASMLEPMALAPSELQLRALREGSYSGSPALFPASWMPSWSLVLPPSIPARLRSLLSGILQVEVFRLRYRVDGAEQGCNYNECGGDGTGKACSEESSLGDKPSQAFLHPIPTSSTEVLDFGTFVSEGSSLFSAPKSQLLYLTWRSLPDIEKIRSLDCKGSSSSLPSEFCFFIESLFHPSTTPPLISEEPIKQRNFWMGALVTSRLHFDALDNIHVCLSGKKRFHLYSPMDLPNLYPDPWKEGQLNNFSSLQSIFLANPECHPRFFQHAKCLIAEVDEGKAIFVPAGWWHEVFTLEETISVNTWFGPSQNASLRPTLLHLKSDCSVGACETNWSAYSLIHMKIRNRLSTAQLERLVFCRANLRLFWNFSSLAGPKQIHPNSINLTCTSASSIGQDQNPEELYAQLHRELETVDKRVNGRIDESFCREGCLLHGSWVVGLEDREVVVVEYGVALRL